MVVLVVDDIENCPEVLNAWEKAGTPGVTVLNSTGLGRLRRAALRDDLPLIPSLQDLFQSGEVHHRTLISVVEEEDLVDRLVAAAERVIGDLDDPHTGFLFVVPVLKAYGMGKHRTDRSQE
jgi:nitrogen regulatory protein PII